MKDIDRTRLYEILEAKTAQSSKSTANRYMALIRAVLRSACEVWEWIDRVPKAPMHSVQSKRTRWLSREGAARLLAELPDHLADMMRFSLSTGLRQRNVCLLQWENVNLERQCA